MNEAIVTQWFELSQQKPWEQGVYECMLEHLGSRVVFGYFDGQSFVRFEHDIDRLLDRMYQGTGASCVKWRGLSSDQSAPKKRAGNKRKTMYVVMISYTSRNYGKPLATFSCNQRAEEYLEKERGMHFYPLYIEKIRFRTPEA